MVLRVAGCDLGKATAKLVVGEMGPNGELRVESAETVAHEGRPLEAFRDWYRRAEVAGCRALGATGLHADELRAPAVSGLPEDACIEAALRLHPELDGPLNVISVGARGYSVLVRDARGRVQYLENDKCSSGTGETMVKIAGRFGLSIEEADALAFDADEAIPITARCSVFAKSEMTHFGNQGRPAEQLFRGYFGSVSAYVSALLARARVDGPVVAIGGAARIRALVRALGEAVGSEIVVLDDPQGIEARGALLLAAEQLAAEPLGDLPTDPEALVCSKERRFRALDPAREHAGRVRRLEAPAVPEGASEEPTILGLDLGSTGSKAVLTSLETGEAVLDLYDRTRGNPVEAAQRLIGDLLSETTPDVRAVALTGSGREAAATVLRAAFPDIADRIVVMNEIVAHATAAIRCDEDEGESLSVVEIGGQDAKFIQVAGGQIVESDMNKACSAGTGSFLEEQAVFYGVHDIAEFTDRAQQATRPPELGQMCTVFVAEAAAEAHNEGFAVDDLFGGFQYSVIHNYINRVMGQRTFADRIFFQGKPASGPSLAWTLAAVTGREVIVPPNPGAMGAWGIGLCAIDSLGRDSLGEAAPFPLADALGARVVERNEFQCRDKRCATLCNIDRTTVAIGNSRQKVLSGGACPKYEIPSLAAFKLPKDAPSPFDERDALIDALDADGPVGDRTVGVPAVGACIGYVPWMVTLLREVGLVPKLLRSDAQSLARGEERCWSYDSCAPVKIAHGALDTDVDRILLPKILSLGDPDGDGGRTCPMEQGLPEMVEAALQERGRDVRIVHPELELDRGLTRYGLLRALLEPIRELGGDLDRLPGALHRAAEAQERFDEELRAIGDTAMRWARANDVPSVAVLGSLHVIHDRGVNAGIPRLLRDNGVIAVPMDCFRVDDDIPSMRRVPWGDANRVMRTAVAARRRGDAYPLLLTSFGCGPASFGEQVFSALMEGFPHTTLESDGHGGTAGYVTRVQAFLHTVRSHDRRPDTVPPHRLALLEPLPQQSVKRERHARLVVPSVGDRLSSVLAAAWRSHGFDAVPSGPPSAEALAAGRKDCSGKECVPYQMVWGSFRKHLEDEPPDRRTLLLQVQGEGRCRNCMFSLKDQLSLERMGLSDRVEPRHISHEKDIGWSFMGRIWTSVVGWDLLYQLACYNRVYETRPGQIDALYQSFVDELERRLAAPVPRGPAGWLETLRGGADISDIIARASWEMAEVRRRGSERDDMRTVLLSGDFYVRVDPQSSDDLARRLSDRGLRPIVEPVSLLAEYCVEERMEELFGMPTGLVDNAIVRRQMAALRRSLYAIARRHNPWLPDHDPRTTLAASDPVLGRHPQGEAPVTVGSVLHAWKSGWCDGVVLASPWGCPPALVSESLLRHRREIPMLYVYTDGSPIDERRLNAFAFRLRRSAPRTRAHAEPGFESTTTVPAAEADSIAAE